MQHAHRVDETRRISQVKDQEHKVNNDDEKGQRQGKRQKCRKKRRAGKPSNPCQDHESGGQVIEKRIPNNNICPVGTMRDVMSLIQRRMAFSPRFRIVHVGHVHLFLLRLNKPQQLLHKE